MQIPKIITPPAAEPLLLTDVKTRLSITDALDDTDISAYIQAAREQAESYMDKSIITQTLEIALDSFQNEMELPRGPVQSVVSVKYIDTDGAEQTVNSTNYVLDDYSPRTWLMLTAGNTWPDTQAAANAVKIRYLAGWGASGSDVSSDIKTALLLAIGHWIRFQAEAESGIGPTRMPRQFYDLLNRHKMYRF